MNKTRVFYPILWTFFVIGTLIGTIGANLFSNELLQQLGVYQMYMGTYLQSFSITEKDWICYILCNRMKFWIMYLLFVFTSAKWIVVLLGCIIFGCIGAMLLVSLTRLCGGISVILFLATLFPHYIAYMISFLFIAETVRITKIVHKKTIIEKVIMGSVCWGIGMICEMFMNPILVYWVVRLVEK